MDPKFELTLRTLQLRITLLNSLEHLIEGTDQRSHFIITARERAKRVILLRGDSGCNLCQIQNGLGDQPQEPRGDNVRYQDGKQNDHYGDFRVLPDFGLKSAQVRDDGDIAGFLASQGNASVESERVLLKLCSVFVPGGHGKLRANPLAPVFREDHSTAVVEACGDNVALGTERG